MKPTNSTLNALLKSRKFFAIEVFTITLVDGTILRYCSGDLDIKFGGNTYSAGGMTGALWSIDASVAQIVEIGTQSKNMTINVMPRSATVFGLPFTTAARYGVFDGAILQHDLAVMPTYGDTSPGLVNMFLGRIAETDIADLQISFAVNSPMELFDQNMPRNLFQPGCLNTLFDSACTLVPTAWQTAATVQAGSTNTMLLVSGPTQVSGFFDQGKLKITSGALSGANRSVKSWVLGNPANQGTLYIWPPLPNAPSAGDTLLVFAGCNKSPTDPNGCTKFNNLAHFRGFPDVPVPETAI